MNEIVNKFLLAGGKFMSEMHLRQPKLTYSVCGPFTKSKSCFFLPDDVEWISDEIL